MIKVTGFDGKACAFAKRVAAGSAAAPAARRKKVRRRSVMAFAPGNTGTFQHRALLRLRRGGFWIDVLKCCPPMGTHRYRDDEADLGTSVPPAAQGYVIAILRRCGGGYVGNFALVGVAVHLFLLIELSVSLARCPDRDHELRPDSDICALRITVERGNRDFPTRLDVDDARSPGEQILVIRADHVHAKPFGLRGPILKRDGARTAASNVNLIDAIQHAEHDRVVVVPARCGYGTQIIAT